MKNLDKNKNKKSCASTSINWYPGHMAKTKRQITEDLKLIDVVIEIIDSRIPISSRNPDIQKMTQNKKKVILLNKADLSDENQNNLWVKKLNNEEAKAAIVDCNSGKGIDKAIKMVQELMKEELEEYASKGRVGRKIRVMVLGIPNVGKSSFINRIAKNNRLEVGNKPGVTRKKQWIRVNENIELLDTPGVLWPKFQDEKVALNLAFTGTIKDDILDKVEIGYQLLKFMIENYRENIISRYGLSYEYIEEVLKQDQPENFNIYEIMLEIGKKRGAIVSGGNVDEEKTARIILEDFRSGKMGRITLEKAN